MSIKVNIFIECFVFSPEIIKTIMDKIRHFLVLLTIPFAGFSQQILFVNDNGLLQANTDTMLYAIQQAGYPGFDYFDARDSLRSPTYLEIAGYDLVIWYCSSDGVGNYFWEGTDSDNFALIQYLNNGGRLWVMGTDLLYDRYATPQQFIPGDFVYDFLGIAEYHAQSYGDDGGLGVELLEGTGFLSWMGNLQWIFQTAWWVDACLPAPAAIGLFRMGPAGYAFDTYFSGFALDNGHTAVSFCFDPAIIDTYDMRLVLTTAIIDYLLNISAAPSAVIQQGIRVFPNPFRGRLNIEFPEIAQDMNIRILDPCGRIILEENCRDAGSNILRLHPDLLPGMYLLQLTDNVQTQAIPVFRMK